MISIAITALVLHFLAIGLYLIVRKGMPIQARRWLLHLGLASAILIPVFLPFDPPIVSSEEVGVFGRISHQQLEAFCKCESPDFSHRVLFRTYAIGKWLTEATPFWMLLSAVLAGFWLMKLGLACRGLFQMVKTGTTRELPGKVTELIPKTPQPTSAFWWGRAYVILGDDTSNLTSEEQKAVMAHELSHLTQKNTLEQIIIRIIGVIWFWNPFIWWMKRELIWLSECQADEAGAGSMGRKAYARLLMKLHTELIPNISPLSSAIKSMIYRRIRRLTKEPQASTSPVSIGVKASFVILVQLLVIGPVSAGVNETLTSWNVHRQVADLPEEPDEVIYCQDCETVCTPDME